MTTISRLEYALDQAEFARILRLGLGRAVVYLDENDAAPYRDALIHACLHLSEAAYDPQLEGPRSQYLFELIQRSSDMSFFRVRILDALTACRETYDLHQLMELAGLLASHGDAEARQLMYARFGTFTSEDIDFNANVMLELDGEAGFLYVLDRVGTLLQQDSDFWHGDWLLSMASDRLGEEAVQRLIVDESATNPKVRAYLDEVQRYREEKPEYRSVATPFLHLSYAELLEAISKPDNRLPKGPGLFWRWGARASEEDIVRVANDLLACDDDDSGLLWRIQVFGQRAFQLAPDRLISLALAADWSDVDDVPTASLDVKISHHSLNALRRIRHPRVRELGLRLLNEPHLHSYAPRMFVNNYENGDSTIFNEFIARDRPDYELHAATMAVQDIYEHTPSPELASTFVLLYDRNPCSHCRTMIVEALIELDTFPDWMARECMFDAVPETREVAQKYLARSNQTPPLPILGEGAGG